MDAVFLILAALSIALGVTPPSPPPAVVMDPPCLGGPCRVVVAQANARRWA